jgi:broad specificity phosphatase PhoE
MSVIEHRRHSWREPPGQHLVQRGVDLARRVGETMGRFDLVVTSDLPRAFETAIAMGYAVDRQEKLLGDDGGIADEADWTLGCAEFARAFKLGRRARDVCLAQAALVRSIASALPPEGRALLVSHGGIIEQGVVGLLPELDFEAWGPAFERCEGVLISFDGDRCTGAEPLRLPAGWQ